MEQNEKVERVKILEKVNFLISTEVNNSEKENGEEIDQI